MSRLSAEELVDATGGLRQGAAQCRFFRRQGLNVFADAMGHPVVTWDAINAVLLGRNGAPEPELDFGALRKAG